MGGNDPLALGKAFVILSARPFHAPPWVCLALRFPPQTYRQSHGQRTSQRGGLFVSITMGALSGERRDECFLGNVEWVIELAAFQCLFTCLSMTTTVPMGESEASTSNCACRMSSRTSPGSDESSGLIV